MKRTNNIKRHERERVVAGQGTSGLTNKMSPRLRELYLRNSRNLGSRLRTEWQFNRIFWPPKSWPNSSPTQSRSSLGCRPSLGGLLGGLKILLNCHPVLEIGQGQGRRRVDPASLPQQLCRLRQRMSFRGAIQSWLPATVWRGEIIKSDGE